MKRLIKIQLVIIVLSLSFSCKKYLDAKPDKSWVVPSTLQDLSLLLDNTSMLNQLVFPTFGEQSCDDYYLTYADWQSLNVETYRNNYIWQKDGYNNNDWLTPYRIAYYANVVLDELPELEVTPSIILESNRVKGSALFLRGQAFYELAQVFCKCYDSSSANIDLGIPLRLNADFNEPSKRSTLQQTYNQIINDLNAAINLLPVTPAYKTRPSKPAAFAVLARTYLAMQDYKNAGLYADSCLQLYNLLIDYNTLNSALANPIARFNDEVIYHTISVGSSILTPPRCKVDSVLQRSYASNDLRSRVYFTANSDGSFSFKGNYHGQTGAGTLFNGIASDEMYLTRAECRARYDDIKGAMQDLNTLLIKRWKTGTFIPVTAASKDQALRLILLERRKELLFRSLRWTDLRRLNKEHGYEVTVTRQLNGAVYTLVPNSLSYVSLIPFSVLSLTNLEQNER